MQTKKILTLLNRIEEIANFQKKRFIDNKEFNRALTLRQSVEFIETYCEDILDILSKYKLGDEK